MATDAKPPATNNPAAPEREKGVKIFMYPKIVFMFPTLITSLICWIGMWMVGADQVTSAKADNTRVESRAAAAQDPAAKEPGEVIPKAEPVPIGPSNPGRFKQPGNILGLIFLLVFFVNMLILAVDFPRFAIVGVVLGTIVVVLSLILASFYIELLGPFEAAIQRIYVYSNAQFYFIFSLALGIVFGIIMATRWLDYWEIMPNEILHHHGPLSDLERFPTLNLKFDKEIPDVFEHMLLGAGRLVLHVQSERKAIILDTVLHVSRKEDALKKLMSRLDVRVTTDQEVAS